MWFPWARTAMAIPSLCWRTRVARPAICNGQAALRMLPLNHCNVWISASPRAFVTVRLAATPPSCWARACGAVQVCEERNGDGMRGASERGTAGVRVGNGEHVAVTDANGVAALVDDGVHARFVIKPAGYTAARDTSGLPDVWRAPGICR